MFTKIVGVFFCPCLFSSVVIFVKSVFHVVDDFYSHFIGLWILYYFDVLFAVVEQGAEVIQLELNAVRLFNLEQLELLVDDC